MPELDNSQKTKDILRAHNMSAKKKYGQNFLIDRSILRGIVSAAEISKEDNVLEIGPGLGTLTQYLCEAAGSVIAIEIDKDLIPVLEETLSVYRNVQVINEDVLKIDVKNLFNGEPFKVVANLPYYITTPIVMKLLEQEVPYESITIMVQKEVAERMQAVPGSKDYGALSLAVQYYTDAKICEYVSPDCFIPQPKVGSAVINLKAHKDSPVFVNDTKILFKIIRAAFNQRRKTLINSIKNAPDLNYTTDDVLSALSKMNKSEKIRGEELSLQEFAELTNLLTS